MGLLLLNEVQDCKAAVWSSLWQPVAVSIAA